MAIFWCVLTSNLELLADEFKNHFLAKKAEIVSLRPEHQKETHFLKRRICVDDFGWHVELGQRYVKSLLDAIAMNHCKSMATLGPKGQESSHVETEKLDLRVPIWCWNLSVYDRTTLRHCGTKEIMREAAGPTTASKTKLKRIARYLTPTVCTEFPFGWEAGGRHPCDRGCRLGWRPKDKVLHVRRSVGHRSVLHCSTLVCDTGNCIAILSRVRGQGDHEGLH